MLFNKDGIGAAELKELLGFIYRSSRFENLISYIGFGERDVIKTIGKEVFQLALEHYNSAKYHQSNPSEEDLLLDELVRKIQLAIALHAYRRYVPSNDVTHSDKGRQIFSSETEKNAFEWQIERDNENLLNLSHEAVDLLLDFLYENLDNQPGVAWATSKAYETLTKLFVHDVKTFEETFFINGSRRVLVALIPSLRDTQEKDIRPCFTKEKYDEIIEHVLDDEPSEEIEAILSLIRPAMVLLALSKAIKRLSVEILPNGIFQNLITGAIQSKSPASAIDRINLSKMLDQEGQRALKQLMEHLRRLSQEAAGETYTPLDPTARMDPELKYFRP